MRKIPLHSTPYSIMQIQWFIFKVKINKIDQVCQNELIKINQ